LSTSFRSPHLKQQTPRNHKTKQKSFSAFVLFPRESFMAKALAPECRDDADAADSEPSAFHLL
jgi:hypothetical protein